MNLQLVLV